MADEEEMAAGWWSGICYLNKVHNRPHATHIVQSPIRFLVYFSFLSACLESEITRRNSHPWAACRDMCVRRVVWTKERVRREVHAMHDVISPGETCFQDYMRREHSMCTKSEGRRKNQWCREHSRGLQSQSQKATVEKEDQRTTKGGPNKEFR